MYYAIVAATMLVLPALCVVLEAHPGGSVLDLLLIGKWFTFWAVGVRLFLAGVRQVIQPRYTASEVLGLKGEEPLLLVRELGFANLAIGLIGLVSIMIPGWRNAGALAGGVFYGLAGINHIFQPQRTRLGSVAMISDLFAAVVLLSAVTAGFQG